MPFLKSVVYAGIVALVPLAAAAQTKPVTKTSQVTATATITKIDAATRNVTLRNDKGEEDTFTAGPDVKRFDQLKVGDKINVTYYESLVFEVRKAGQPSTPTADALAAGRAKSVPGGGVVTQQTRTVTVKAIDPAVPSITVTTPDGLTFTRKIEDRKNLEGVKPGDRIDITYSQALLIAAQPAK